MAKLKIVEKAYVVWVHSQLAEHPFNSPDELDVVYAESASKAKYHCWIKGEKNEDGDDARWIDIKVKRRPYQDKVEYEGNVVKRVRIKLMEDEKEENKLLELRIKKLEQLDPTDMYYVQDARGYVGNSVSWWALNNRGYTCDIEQAHRYTKDEIIRQFSDCRDIDVIWSARHVDTKIKKHVDAQYLDYEYSIKNHK